MTYGWEPVEHRRKPVENPKILRKVIISQFTLLRRFHKNESEVKVQDSAFYEQKSTDPAVKVETSVGIGEIRSTYARRE